MVNASCSTLCVLMLGISEHVWLLTFDRLLGTCIETISVWWLKPNLIEGMCLIKNTPACHSMMLIMSGGTALLLSYTYVQSVSLELQWRSAYHFCFWRPEITWCMIAEQSNPDLIEPHNPLMPDTRTHGQHTSVINGRLMLSVTQITLRLSFTCAVCVGCVFVSFLCVCVFKKGVCVMWLPAGV